MEPYLIILGTLLNSLLMILNRFWRKLPDWLYLPGLCLGIALMLIGLVLMK